MADTIGDAGFILASLGVIAFAVAFLTCVRWWTDALGWTIAGGVALMSIILILSLVRMSGGELVFGVHFWRALFYPSLGVFVWVSTGIFLWAQFIAPRVKRKKKEKIDA